MTQPSDDVPATGRFRLYEAFGERKPLSAWGGDPRCPVSRQGLYYRVHVLGMSVEQAFAWSRFDPSRPSAVVDPVGNVTGLDPGRRGFRAATIRAWGEDKTAREWAGDPRAVVAAPLIAQRVKKGVPAELAIVTPPFVRLGNPYGQVTAWGETKNLSGWEADPRARVCAEIIRKRLAAGLRPEDAIGLPPHKALERVGRGRGPGRRTRAARPPGSDHPQGGPRRDAAVDRPDAVPGQAQHLVEPA
ncbi:MAG: hypothetical protein K2X82_15375 [Gemmataceae bacterium]|nr:hypothetical protein [Gemmataceae bacterium]